MNTLQSIELPAPQITSFPHSEQLVSDKDLYAYTGLTPRFWQERRRTGESPPYIKVSEKCVRYRWGDVHKWLEQKKCINISQECFQEERDSK